MGQITTTEYPGYYQQSSVKVEPKMLSTLALKSGTFGRIALTGRCASLVSSGVRLCSTNSSKLFEGDIGRSARRSTSDGLSAIHEDMARWDVANEIYYGKDRDTKNFPTLKIMEKVPPTRFVLFPDSWFVNLYDKTGVSGSYLLVFGLTAALLSKEIIVFDHGMIDALIFFPTIMFASYKFGPKIVPWFQKIQEADTQRRFIKPMEDIRNEFTEVLDSAEKDLWRKEGQKYIFESMKENIGLQLEANYRKRLNQVYTDVKKRLDYQLEVQNAKRRFEQENMVNWITKNVIASITPKQEKETLAQCIQNLKNLSKTATAV